MQILEVNTLGLTVKCNAPSSVEEYDRLAKKEGACLIDGIKNTIYRSYLNQVREGFCEALEKTTGITRKVAQVLDAEGKPKTTKDEDGNVIEVLVYDETEKVYVARVCAETGKPIEAYQDLINSVAEQIAFDPSATEPKPKAPAKTPKLCLEAAKKLIEEGRGSSVAASLSAKLNRTINGDDVDDLGRAIAEFKRNEEKRIMAEMVSV